MGVFNNYITPQGEVNVVTYRYKGSDASLFYKYVLSPIAQFLVDRVIPTWVAPNLITLIGFMCTLIPHITILIMFPRQLAGDVPSWLCFATAIGQFTYMILDNADGKQARKTGSSSPLGLLFDHGCDAMNTFVAGVSFYTVIQLGESVGGVTAYILPMVTFYLATWEEYYTESLDLPIINGPNEGLLLLMIMFVISGIFGCDFWNHTIHGFKLNQLALYAFIFMSAITYIGNLINVYRKGHNKSFLKAVYNLIIIIYATFTLLFATYFLTPDNQGRVRLFIYIVGFSFCKLVGHMQVAHVTTQPYHQFTKSSLLICTLLNTFTICSIYTELEILKENYLLYALLCYSILTYAQFCISVSRQFCRILGINVFSINKRKVSELVAPLVIEDTTPSTS